MNNHHEFLDGVDPLAILDGLDQGILLFDDRDQLVFDNAAARAILGPRLAMVRAAGWPAVSMLFHAGHDDQLTADDIRARASRQAQPVRFHIYLSGTYTPCSASAIPGPQNTLYTLLTLQRPDWSALTELMSTFRSEARIAITSTRGHAELIKRVIARRKETTTADQLARQVAGFAEIMAVHMARLENLVGLLERLEDVRTGNLYRIVNNNTRPVRLAEFLEDLLEELVESPLLEESNPHVDHRERIYLDIPDETTIEASKHHLSHIFRDLLRNALMYSEPDTPITVRATPSEQMRSVQIDISDQGFGIRTKERSCVFVPFQRARQPQIIAEFGYGLSLYLVKMEIEAMKGRIWFESEEGVGTTFSFRLPLWTPPDE